MFLRRKENYLAWKYYLFRQPVSKVLRPSALLHASLAIYLAFELIGDALATFKNLKARSAAFCSSFLNCAIVLLQAFYCKFSLDEKLHFKGGEP